MNTFQTAVASSYGGGDFSYLLDAPDWRQQLDICGDSLFRFLMIELGNAEGCDSREVALRRLEVAVADVQAVASALAELT